MRFTLGAALALLACVPAFSQTTITPLPTPPSRGDPGNFANRADAFLGALPLFGTQANAVASETRAARDAAAASAQTALNAPGTTASSTTSLTVATGSKSLTIQTGKAFVAGQFVMIASSATPGSWMNGQITSYDSGSGALVVSVAYIAGSGTFAAWNVALSTPTTDLLAGQPGSYYANIPSRLGYTPANRAGDAFTGNISTSAGISAASGAFSGSLKVNGSDVWTTTSFNPANYAALAGAVFTGNVTATGLLSTGGVTAGNLGQDGAAKLERITGGPNTGFVSFHNVAQQRVGYVGYVAPGGPIQYVSENSGGHSFTGGTVTIAGNLVVTGFDFRSYRPGGTTGVVYLASDNTKYLYNDGSSYNLPNQGLVVGGTVTAPNVTAPGSVTTGRVNLDAQFYSAVSGNSAIVNWDSNDYSFFDRNANKYVWMIGGTPVMSLDASGTLRVAGNIIANTTP